MRWLGIAARSFDLMCARANERREIRAARLLTLHAAWVIDRHGVKAARDEISAIKFSVANTMLKAVDTAIQVHGALGVTDDTILSYWYRHERAARIYDGADEVHKTTLGRRILRRQRDADLNGRSDYAIAFA
jgi:acyl-CoA dehydrogenase